MKNLTRMRSIISLIVVACLLAMPTVALAKKGEKYYRQGLDYERAQQWEKAVEQYALAVAANPADTEYQLRYRRAIFNASQVLMQQGRALAEKSDFIGAYNAFRQSYAYDPVNELALSEMERMLRLQKDKAAGLPTDNMGAGGNLRASQTSLRDTGALMGTTPTAVPVRDVATAPVQQRVEVKRIVTYSGDLKSFIRNYAEMLDLNVVFDSQSFRQPRNIDISLKDVTAAQALDYVFLQEGLFFQKLGRRTILVADQQRRGTYQQLVIRTFYLSNLKPADAEKYISRAIPAQAGRPTTIAIPDPDTNSITIRDTSENVRLIGDLLASLDKDRAEVVMDVNIYEVSRDDLLRIGNQIGTNTTLVNLGGAQGGVSGPSTFPLALPKALGVGFALPPSAISLLQGKDRTRLIFTTQIHAFNNEESTARIGQRVPVQTAQTFPFGTTNTTTQPGGVNTGVGFAGGFPVFNYEQTGLTLKFQPQIFPNLDVQVKMSIESKDVINPGNPTPTFTERSIAGTARIQNNRTMMLASIAQGSQSQSRVGLPILGLIPVLGRLFTAPEDRNRQVDIVIAVTPRVLRAPAITPDDELMRPSGTLQTPTSGSVQAVLEEAEREDQLAAARRAQNQALAQNAQPQQPQAAQPAQAELQKPILDEEPPAYVPAPRALMGGAQASQPATPTDAATNIPTSLPANIKPLPVNVPKVDVALPGNASGNAASSTGVSNLSMPASNTSNASSSNTGAAPVNTGAVNDAPALRRLDNPEPSVKPSFIGPQLETDVRREEVRPAQTVQSNTASASQPKAAAPAETPLVARSAAGLMLLPKLQEMKVGERRRITLLLKTDAPLGLAALTFKFDPQQLRIGGVSAGNLLAAGADGAQPILTQSVDAKGLLIVSVAPASGSQPLTGAGVLIFIDLEAVAPGETSFSFDKNNVHLVAADGRSVLIDLSEVKVVVKQ
ncbi:MAG TPA: secretin N-terminal domain-containing protein [Pyrinomonadaceae bacterium]|nr:secretin N-terminal domain-containing protein [Pyrinomonadaceae bacterium]